MDFERENSDFQYLIRNGKDDSIILIRRTSEGLNMPYRKFEIENLGTISPLKMGTPARNEEVEDKLVNRESNDGFLSPRSTKRLNLIPKTEIFSSINSFLDGFSHESRRQQGRRSPRRNQ